MIAALEKANAVLRHASYLGVRSCEFEVLLTSTEGWELVEYLQGQAHGLDPLALEADVGVARVVGDPFHVLQHFSLLGLPIVRQPDVVH